MTYLSGRSMFYTSEQIPSHHVIILLTSVIVSVFLIKCFTQFIKKSILITFYCEVWNESIQGSGLGNHRDECTCEPMVESTSQMVDINFLTDQMYSLIVTIHT